MCIEYPKSHFKPQNMPNKNFLHHWVLSTMHKINTCILFCLILSSSSVWSQSISHFVIGNAGAYTEDATIGSLHWTVGEIAIEHYENSVVLSQGFHQTYNDLLSTATWELPQVELDLNVYPNPTSSWLYLKASQTEYLQVVVANVMGQTVIPRTSFSMDTQLDFSRLPGGMYLLTVFMEGQLVKTYKIQKTQY